jgi:hypothetical protein
VLVGKLFLQEANALERARIPLNMKTSLFFALAVIPLFLAGCVQTENAASPTETAASPIATVASAEGAGVGAAEETGGLQFKLWNASDGSITIQVPVGWTATEKQVDTCTVNWVVTSLDGMSEAFMNNQILVFKTEDARQMYKQYGLAGIDSAPVSGFLGAEQAVAQIVAPLSGSSNVQVVGRDAALTQQFSQAVCAGGLAACDAQAFRATFSYNGVQMRGEYLAQSFDLGDGSTWWINLWGYASPAAEWDTSSIALEKIFTSVQYTSSWAEKCRKNTNEASSVINDVIKARQQASDRAAEQWDEQISS